MRVSFDLLEETFTDKFRDIKIGEVYKHFKGHIVRIVCVAKNTETMEEEVVYYHIKNKQYWVRRLSMFNSLVDKDKYPDVKQVYRFERYEQYES